MISRRTAVAVAVLVALSLPASAAAEPFRLHTAAQCVTEGGSDVELPPGIHLSEPDWEKIDAEIARLQEAETRLTAENAKAKELSSPDTSWWLLGLAFSAGIAAGVAASR